MPWRYCEASFEVICLPYSPWSLNEPLLWFMTIMNSCYNYSNDTFSFLITWRNKINKPCKKIWQSTITLYTVLTSTCSELSIANIHANATVFSLTASIPNTQVTPSTGSKTIDAFTSALVSNCQSCNKTEQIRILVEITFLLLTIKICTYCNGSYQH